MNSFFFLDYNFTQYFRGQEVNRAVNLVHWVGAKDNMSGAKIEIDGLHFHIHTQSL